MFLNKKMGGIGNSNFGFNGSSSGGGGGGTIGGGGTLNYICKYTPNGTNIGNSLLYDNGTSVGLGTVIPDASAILELSSTTQGFATPRMTTLQRDAIVTPVIGLLIYNTSSSFFNYWDGVAWIQMDTSTGGDVSGSGTTNYAVKWTDGINSVIGDGTWAFSGNDYYPVTTGSNIGDATHRIGTIFMASVFDYANDLTFFNGTSTTATLTTGGNFGIGKSPTAKLDILQNTVGTGVKGLSVNFNTIGEVFYIDDNGYAKYYGGGFTIAGSNGILNLVSNGGVSPSISFKYNNGANDSGFLYGVGASMFFETPAFGLGTSYFNPQARLHIQGVNATLANYSLKVDDSASSPLFYVRNDAKVSIGKATTLTTLDILGDTTNTLFKLNNANFAFADKLRIDNNGGFYSSSVNNFGVGGSGTFYADHASATFVIGGQGAMYFNNAGGAGNLYGYAVIGGGVGVSDSTYRLKLYSDNSGNAFRIESIATGSANDAFDGYMYGINLTSSGVFNNTGAGTFYKVGLNVNVSNGDVNYAALFNGGNVGIGTVNPNAMLDISASGTGTVGLNLNTSSTQDAKLHFRTNNSVNPRSQIYLEDTTQTLNIYTLNNDTIFWNGNGLAQTKTLTLFTDTTAKFESRVGIGISVGTTETLYVKGDNSVSSHYALKVDNSASSPLLYVRNDAKVSIGKATTLTTLDILGDTTNTLFKLNNANFSFADKLRIDNDGSFYSGSINAFGGFGVGTYTTDQLNYTFNTSFSTYLAFTNAGGAGNKTSYGIIGGAIGSSDSDYRLVILNSDTSTISGSGLKVLSTGASVGNDGFDYYNYGVNINSSGIFTNSGSGTSYKIGLNVNVSNGEVNYAALFNGGNVGIGTLSPSKTLTVISQGTNKMILGIGTNILSSPYDIVNTYSAGNGKIIYRDQSNITGYTDGLLHVDYLDATTLSLHSRWYDGTNGVENIRIAGKGISWFNGGDVAIGTNSASAQLHIKGIDATSSNYSLKVDDSASSSILSIRNDHFVDINVDSKNLRILSTSTGALTACFSIFDSGYGEAFRVEGTYGRNYMGTTPTSFNNSATLNLGSWGLGRFLYFGTDGSQATFTDADGTGIIFTGKQKTLATTEFKLVSDEGLLVGNGNVTGYFRRNVDIGGNGNGDGVSRVFIKGVDSTSSNYGLTILNSSSSPLLYAKNDGEIGMNGFTIRQLASATYFKTSGTNGYIFNNASDSTNLGKISNTGQILFGDLTDVNYVGVGIAVKALSLTSNGSKEIVGALFKSNTDQDGVYFSSKQGAAYVQSYSVNTVNQSLILGGRNSSAGTLETLVLDSNGNVGIGTTTPATSALLDLTSTTGSLLVPRMTTAQKNALTPTNGMILYDTTLDKFQGYEAGAWVNLI